MARSLERYFNFGETTRCRGIRGGHDPFDIAAQNRQLLIAEHDKRDCPSRQVLLIAQVFVGRQQNIKDRASAAAISSPFDVRSHPRSMASTTTWPVRACRSGAGVPLSKRMNIDHGGTARNSGSVEAARRELDHGDDLVSR
jgi:hypothetical protein